MFCTPRPKTPTPSTKKNTLLIVGTVVRLLKLTCTIPDIGIGKVVPDVDVIDILALVQSVLSAVAGCDCFDNPTNTKLSRISPKNSFFIILFEARIFNSPITVYAKPKLPLWQLLRLPCFSVKAICIFWAL